MTKPENIGDVRELSTKDLNTLVYRLVIFPSSSEVIDTDPWLSLGRMLTAVEYLGWVPTMTKISVNGSDDGWMWMVYLCHAKFHTVRAIASNLPRAVAEAALMTSYRVGNTHAKDS